MREADFNTALKKALQSHGAWAHKMADSPTSWTEGLTQFTPEKPADITACYRGLGILIESKQMKKWSKFGLKQLRLSQIHNLNQMHKAGGAAWVFLHAFIKEQKIDLIYPFEWCKWRHHWAKAPISMPPMTSLPWPIVKFRGAWELTDWLKQIYSAHREGLLGSQCDESAQRRSASPPKRR